MTDSEKLKIIEEILVEMFIYDDSYVVDTIVGKIRRKTGEKTFAFGADFEDKK